MNPSAWSVLLLGCATANSTVAAPEDLPPGLALHMDFEPKDGGLVPNLAGPVSDGLGHEARFVPVEGFGHALSLRQNNEELHYVDVPDHPALNAPRFTVAAWVCPRQTGLGGAVVCKHDWFGGGGRGYTLRCNKDDRVNFTVGAGGWIAPSSKSVVRSNHWVHLAGAFDGKTVMVYFNGRLEGTVEAPKEYTPSPYRLRIGHGTFKLDRHRKFDGKIDDLTIWNRCLTPDELRAVFESTREGRPGPPAPERVATLVAGLGAKGFQSRQAAQQSLSDLGNGIIPLLEKHLTDPDPEIRSRLRKLIEELGAAK